MASSPFNNTHFLRPVSTFFIIEYLTYHHSPIIGYHYILLTPFFPSRYFLANSKILPNKRTGSPRHTTTSYRRDFRQHTYICLDYFIIFSCWLFTAGFLCARCQARLFVVSPAIVASANGPAASRRRSLKQPAGLAAEGGAGAPPLFDIIAAGCRQGLRRFSFSISSRQHTSRHITASFSSHDVGRASGHAGGLYASAIPIRRRRALLARLAPDLLRKTAEVSFIRATRLPCHA